MRATRYEYEKQLQKDTLAAANVAALVKVIDFDPEKMTVDVQPMSKRLENGEYNSRPPILGVPMACVRGDGLIFRPPIKVGDIGVVLYLDHDIDKIIAGGIETAPNTERNHSASDAVYLGGIVTWNAPVKSTELEGAILGAEDGSVYIAVSNEGIAVKGDVDMEGSITIKGDLNITGEAIKINGNIDITGESVKIDGNVELTGGTVTATGLIDAQGGLKVKGNIEVVEGDVVVNGYSIVPPPPPPPEPEEGEQEGDEWTGT